MKTICKFPSRRGSFLQITLYRNNAVWLSCYLVSDQSVLENVIEGDRPITFDFGKVWGSMHRNILSIPQTFNFKR